MARKITRTIKSANVTYQYVDIPTSTIKEASTVVTSDINSETKMLRQLKRKFNSAIIEVIKIIDVEIVMHKYEMLESDFIENAWIVDEEE